MHPRGSPDACVVFVQRSSQSYADSPARLRAAQAWFQVRAAVHGAQLFADYSLPFIVARPDIQGLPHTVGCKQFSTLASTQNIVHARPPPIGAPLARAIDDEWRRFYLPAFELQQWARKPNHGNVHTVCKRMLAHNPANAGSSWTPPP